MSAPRLTIAKLTMAKLIWIALVLLVAINFAAVQTESAMDLHAHHHGGANDHCCAGCHAGHFPVLDTASSIQLGVAGVSRCDSIIEVGPSASNDGQIFNPSRAPPV